MLEIIYNLTPFFEDCYRRINVREYAKLVKISPPTASKLLVRYKEERFLKMEKDRNYLFFYANKENKIFIDLSRIYWRLNLSNLIDYLNKNLVNPNIILFGSLAKAEAKSDSDLDIVIISKKKKLNFKKYEKKLKRKIQIFWFDSIKDIENKELAKNIINGYLLEGRMNL